MAKVVDITEKLEFEGNPCIMIKGKKLEVNADAKTILKIMGIIGDGENIGTDKVVDMYELIFSEGERAKIDKLNLNFKDFKTLVETSINLITGEEETGE